MKTKILAILALLFLVSACKNVKPNSVSQTQKKMFKVTIMYPNSDGKTFNMEYYKNKHMPMLAELFAPTMKSYGIDKGISGRTAEDDIPYLAIGYMYFDTVADYQKVFAPNARKILDDIPNYTNIRPIVQISEVVQ